jgi:hypothetical protein
MPSNDPAPAPPEPVPSDAAAPDLAEWHAIPLARWYADVAETNPHRCRHKGPCGERFLCDRDEHRTGGYPTVEVLANDLILFHCEGLILAPNDPEYRARRAGLGRRAVG